VNDAPTLILAGARFPTLKTQADCLVIQAGRIADLARWSDIKLTLPSSAAVKDVTGACVLPGLGDAHVHFAATGFLATALDCQGIVSRVQLLDAIATAAAHKAPGELILGLRLEHSKFPDKALPTLDELDAAAPDNPLYIRHITGHASLANRQALALLDFPLRQPGVKLDEHNQPTGELIAQATQRATQQMYALNAAQLGYETAFRAAAQAAARSGCTVVHALDDLGAVEALLALNGALPVRVLPYTQSFDLEAVEALGLPRIGGCHGCALDGDFDMFTAALSEPYHERPHAMGVLYQDYDNLTRFVCEAHRRGLQCAFHAVGDRAVEQALSVFEAAQAQYPRPNARHRIEHAQLVDDSHFERARRAGVVLGLQPSFNHVWDHCDYVQWIGERHRRIDPLASFYKLGIPLAGGSDSTVTDMKPLLGIHAAVNHSRVEERLSVDAAIEMFSYGVAYSTHHEHERGRLMVGFAADLTLVAENPLTVDPCRIKDIAVLMTVVDGRIVYES
jgi:predicted amidohydrolase YtcJ